MPICPPTNKGTARSMRRLVPVFQIALGNDAWWQRVLCVLVNSFILLYGECMARKISTTIRLNQEDVRALKRARAAGHSASELVRKGLRVVASRYYTGRRPPSTLLFESTDTKLGDESELFRDLEN